MPRNNRLPGPFQNLKKGPNRIVLWPVPLGQTHGARATLYVGYKPGAEGGGK